MLLLCETPKSPPGDYNYESQVDDCLDCLDCVCETPKSPPGDYNLSITFGAIALVRSIRVKHLNPRQGITTLHRARRILPTTRRRARVKHLNPRQGITTHLCTQHHPGHLCTQV